MPVIGRFLGMIIKMYFLASEHNPPHIHVMYGEHIGVINIETSKMIYGDLPNNVKRKAEKWTTIHKEELIRMWETQEFKMLPPLD